MVGGNYQTAIPVLRQAVAAAAPASLTYAYALYDLGHSLRLAGDPRAAVPILWRRLQIPNQTGVVRAELTLALRALGQSPEATGGAAPRPRGHGHRGNGAVRNGAGD
jgi:tetratricopeptide (TPR) repeat protein